LHGTFPNHEAHDEIEDHEDVFEPFD